MPRSVQQYLDAHEGNAEEALKAAVRDVAQRESQNTAARAFRRAYQPLIEALKLPADVDTDSEQEAQTLAARTLESLSQSDDSEDDAASILLAELVDRLKLDLAPLEELADNATDAQVSAALDLALKPVTEPLGRVQTLEREQAVNKAAQAAGVPADALAEFLGDRVPVSRKVKGEDGTETDVYGLGEGESWKALGEFKTVQALAGTGSKPEPKAAPTGVVGGKATPRVLTDEEYRAEIRARQDVAF